MRVSLRRTLSPRLTRHWGRLRMAQHERTDENIARTERPFGKPDWRRDAEVNEENSDGTSGRDAGVPSVHGWRLWTQPKQVFRLLKATYAEYNKDDVPRMGAAWHTTRFFPSLRFW